MNCCAIENSRRYKTEDTALRNEMQRPKNKNGHQRLRIPTSWNGKGDWIKKPELCTSHGGHMTAGQVKHVAEDDVASENVERRKQHFAKRWTKEKVWLQKPGYQRSVPKRRTKIRRLALKQQTNSMTLCLNCSKTYFLFKAFIMDTLLNAHPETPIYIYI